MVSDVSEKPERWGPCWGCRHSNFLSKNDDLRLFGIQMTSPVSVQQFVKYVCLWELFALLASVHLVAMVGSPWCEQLASALMVSACALMGRYL